MQRAPVFVFEDARAARDFGQWVEQSFAIIKTKADQSSRFGSLRDIEQYTLGPMRWLRFNFTAGDAAGQNMVTQSVHEVCKWMIDQQPRGLTDFALAANLDTDKKHSSLNNLHTRGKRVVAEVTLPAALIEEVMHRAPSTSIGCASFRTWAVCSPVRSATAPTTEWDRSHIRRLRPGCR